MKRDHNYNTSIVWTGNRGTGTSSYRSYNRSYDLSAPGKTTIAASADATFHGEAAKWNPEEMLQAALSSCHLLSYLHLCADAGITVLTYTDNAEGSMRMNPDGSGQFTSVTLHPVVTIAAGQDISQANALHHRAHELCFIANSVNFPVACKATTTHAAHV
jgi:organic hydroperoxide reductase OsmC/OhrA